MDAIVGEQVDDDPFGITYPTDAQRAELGSMGFDTNGVGASLYLSDTTVFIWYPGCHNAPGRRYVAEYGVPVAELQAGTGGVEFDDPVAAARWLIIEVADHDRT